MVACPESEYVVVNFLFQLIFIFHLFLDMVIYANEFKIKEKQKLNYIKKKIADLRESKKSLEFWILSSGILAFVGGTWIPDSLCCIPDPKPRIPDSTSKNFPDSGI